MEAIVGVDDAALILLASLAAFGIAVTAEQGIDAVGPWVTDQFEQYVNSIGDSASVVWDKIRYGVSKGGELILNGFGLRYNAKFGEWLVNKFSMQDDSSYQEILDYTYSLGGYPIVCLPTYNTYINNYRVTLGSSSNNPVYLLPAKLLLNGSYQNITAIFSYSYVSGSYMYIYDRNGSTKYQGGISSRIYGSFVWNYLWPDNYLLPSAPRTAQFASESALLNFLRGNSVSTDPVYSDITVTSGSISVPDVGDYDDDDGILIDGLGSWGDSLDDVLDHVGDLTDPNSTVVTDGDITYVISPESVLVDDLVDVGQLTTENSPGFFNGLPLVGGIPDIQFGSLWHYVTDWVSSMSGGLALIGGIMFSLPFVAAFYALVVILLVLSLWRLLRSA